MHQEDKLPKYLALKVRMAYFGEIQKAMQNKDSTLKFHTLDHTCSKIKGRNNHLKMPGSNPLVDLGGTHGEIRNWDSPWGDICW